MKILRRCLRLLVATVLVVVALVGLLAAAVWVVLPLDATREWVRTELQTTLATALDDRVGIEEVAHLSPVGITLTGVSIGAKPAIVRAESLRVALEIPRLFPPRVAFSVSLVRPEVDLERASDGRWNVERLGGEAKAGPDDDSGPGIPRWLAQVDARIEDGRVHIGGLAPEPLELSAISLDGRLWVGILRSSVVEIDALSAKLGAGSRLDLHGTYELEGAERLRAKLRAHPLVGTDLAGLVPSLRPAATVEATVEVDGTLEEPGLKIDLVSGEAHVVASGDLRPKGDEQAVTVTLDATAVDPGLLFEGAPGGDVTAHVEGSASLSGDELRRLDGRVEVTDSRLFDVDIRSFSVAAETRNGDVDVRLEAATPDDGVRTNLTGSVQLGAPHRTRVGGDVHLGDPAALTEELRGYLSGSELDATIEADVADPLAEAPRATLDVKIAPGRLRGLPVTGAEFRARLEPDLVSVDRLWIGADRTDLEGHAWAQLGGRAEDRSVGGELRGPASLALFFDAYGVVQTDVTLWGRTTDLGLAALVNSSGLVELAGLEGTFSARLDAAHLGGDRGRADLSLNGFFTPEASLARFFGRDELQTKLSGSWRREPAGGALPVDRIAFEGALGTSGPGLGLKADVELQGERTRVDVGRFDVRPVVGPPWTLVPPARIRVDADAVAVEGLRVNVGPGRIDAEGRVMGRSASDLQVRVADFDLGSLCELLLVGDECAGRLGASLEVKGTATRPEIGFDLRAADLVVSEQRYGELTAKARSRGQELGVEIRVSGGRAGSLRIDGNLPLEVGSRAPVPSMTRPARLSLVAEGLEIDAFRAMAGSTVRTLDGRATARVDLRGPLEDPHLDGDLEVAGLQFGAAATGVTHSGRLRLSIDPSRFSIDQLTLDDGALTAGGEVRLSGGLPKSFDLWVALAEAEVVRRSEADVTVSGRVEFTGPVEAPQLDGDVTIDRATIRPTIAPGSGAPKPDPSVVVVRRYGQAPAWTSGVPPELGGEAEPLPVRPVDGPRAGAGESELYDDLSMMVTVRLGDPVAVRRYDANIRLEGEVYLTKKPADELRISGGIGGRRGWYIFQGRRFEIQSAYVTFSGETPLDPYLNVQAKYRTGEYTVWIRITGTAKHPSLDLSSDPPLDQSDILSVILFGTPASKLDDSQGRVLQSQALALLASYVAPELQRSVLDTFGLTSLTFSMPTGDTAGTVGVGRYFGDDLFISVARDFGGPSGGTERQLQGLVGSSVTIQYYLTPQITVQGASSTEGESSVDVIWHRRY